MYIIDIAEGIRYSGNDHCLADFHGPTVFSALAVCHCILAGETEKELTLVAAVVQSRVSHYLRFNLRY